jgi:hypothetical protein
MTDIEKNIKRVVADKAIKDIHKIVKDEAEKEKQEKSWALVVSAIIVSAVLVLLLLKSI